MKYLSLIGEATYQAWGSVGKYMIVFVGIMGILACIILLVALIRGWLANVSVWTWGGFIILYSIFCTGLGGCNEWFEAGKENVSQSAAGFGIFGSLFFTIWIMLEMAKIFSVFGRND